MSTLEPAEIVVGQTGSLYVAPVGTAFPADVSTPIDTGDWIEVGLIDADGVQFTLPKNMQYIRSWQVRRSTRAVRGDIDDVVGFNLQQWNDENLILALGGGEIVDGRYTPPPESEVDERAFLVEALDGDTVIRFGAYRVVNQADATFTWSRGEESKLPIEFMVLAPAGLGDPWFFDFDFAAAGS